ncbi:hypothetical protein QQZ08_002744 [Neonectria magnoliae]|uniref:Uncharacterized protein n=1 Tax=Neonectria magnoliae TaxID=2732573 RepID=A0ABR1ICE2_9HYPO
MAERTRLSTYSPIGVLNPVPAINPSLGKRRPTLTSGKANSDLCWEPEPKPEPTATPVPLQTWWLWTITDNPGSGNSFPGTDTSTFFQIFDHDPNCNEGENSPQISQSEDLSHDGDIGIRRGGCGGGFDVKEVEFRTEIGHWSTPLGKRSGGYEIRGTAGFFPY